MLLAQAELSSVRQNSKSVSTFANICQESAQKAYPGNAKSTAREAVLLSIFVNGLQPEIRKAVRRLKPKTFQEAKTMALHEEAIQALDNSETNSILKDAISSLSEEVNALRIQNNRTWSNSSMNFSNRRGQQGQIYRPQRNNPNYRRDNNFSNRGRGNNNGSRQNNFNSSNSNYFNANNSNSSNFNNFNTRGRRGRRNDNRFSRNANINAIFDPVTIPEQSQNVNAVVFNAERTEGRKKPVKPRTARCAKGH